MKTLLFLFISLMLVSCKKNTSPTNTNPGFINSFLLKKDGVLFSPGYLEISNPFGYAVAIAAAENSNSNANVYSFLINKNIPVGTYDYETMTDVYDCWFSYSSPNFDLCYINTGTFEIIQQDTIQKFMEMKFQFEMEDSNQQTYQITEGRCKINY